MDNINLGKRIREERQKLNLTQEKLAEDINVSSNYIGLIERGERTATLDTIITIANRLGVTVDFLLKESLTSMDCSSEKLWMQIMDNRSNKEKEMVVNMLKLMFSYMDNN